MGAGLHAHDLLIGAGAFDPSQPNVKSQLTAKLGVGLNSVIQRMQGPRGGLNEGVWTLEDGSRSFVLKLVKSRNGPASMPTEAERLVQLSRQHPSVASDPALAFPQNIFRCLGACGDARYDLIVMRKAPGQPLADVIARKWHGGQASELMRIFELLGCFLADFHARYGNWQHGDFQPSNVFYDEATGKFTMLDVSDIAPQLGFAESDVEHFMKSIGLLARFFGPHFDVEARRHFEAGYCGSGARARMH
jgi:Ser/Thr protein kinase RdoA (MazF antagonist)